MTARNKASRRRALAGAGILCSLLLAGAAAADTLDRVRETGMVRIGYRPDAAPFSSVDASGRPIGYSIDLCERIVGGMRAALGDRPVTVEHVQLAAAERFDALTSQRIDLLCEATSMTLSRREQVDFSLTTFITGASVLALAEAARAADPDRFPRTVGVLAGTTTEQVLRGVLPSRSPETTVVAVTSHDAAVGLLTSRQIEAYIADRDVLLAMARAPGRSAELAVAEAYLTVEPYAIAMRRGEDRLRLIADRTLVDLYRSGRIREVWARWFPAGLPINITRALFLITEVPE